MQIELFVTAGAEPAITVGEPGTQGPTVTGMHGIGVSTPSAAAVAAATIGLASDRHIPNGRMLTIGAESVIAANGRPPATIRFVGSTFNVPGAAPNEHCVIAVATVAMPIVNLPGRGAAGPPTAVGDHLAAPSRPRPGRPPSR